MAKLETVTHMRIEYNYNLDGIEKDDITLTLKLIHQLRDQARESYKTNSAMKDTLNGLQYTADTLHALLTDRPIRPLSSRY